MDHPLLFSLQLLLGNIHEAFFPVNLGFGFVNPIGGRHRRRPQLFRIGKWNPPEEDPIFLIAAAWKRAIVVKLPGGFSLETSQILRRGVDAGENSRRSFVDSSPHVFSVETRHGHVVPRFKGANFQNAGERFQWGWNDDDVGGTVGLFARSGQGKKADSPGVRVCLSPEKRAFRPALTLRNSFRRKPGFR